MTGFNKGLEFFYIKPTVTVEKYLSLYFEGKERILTLEFFKNSK